MFDAPDESFGYLPFQQSAVYAAAVLACGAKARLVDVGVGRAFCVERWGVRAVFRGPVWQDAIPVEDKVRAVRHLARRLGVTLVTPDEPLAGVGMMPLVTPMHHAIWDLAGDLRAGLDPRWRNHLSAAERLEPDLRPGDGAVLDFLVHADMRQCRARHYRSLPPAFTRALPAGALRIWQWRQGGGIEAAMCLVRHGVTASYHLAWAGPAARAGAVHQVMLYRAALALRAEGVRWLDLGSVDSERALGLARFKLGTGAALKRLGPTLLVLP